MREKIETAPLRLRVNGEIHEVPVSAERTLLSVLRDDLDLTGAKYGCGEAQCGACIVLLDDEPVPACVTPAVSAAGRAVLTIEGLAEGGAGPLGERSGEERAPHEGEGLHPVQQAFIAETAMQCGYCTPGMIMQAVALLRRQARPSDAEIVEAMNGNVCRCGVYPQIVRAVRRAAEQLAVERP
ncbi:MAG: (2Fe-2S)-binding protein [Chloroflexota bacterium]|nr:(2Fe-2S)-binding protein [Chloroflexota bacterium]